MARAETQDTHSQRQTRHVRAAKASLSQEDAHPLEGAHARPARITRRELLAAAGASATVAAVSLVGCAPLFGKTSPAPTATPFTLHRPATLYADATIPTALANTIAGHLTSEAGISSVTRVSSVAAQPDLILTFGKLPAGYVGAAIGPSAYTAFTHLRVPVDNVTTTQARGLLSGAISDWQMIGAPYSLPVSVGWLKGLPLRSEE